MSNLIEDLTALFTFLFAQLGSIANFFTSTTLGQVLLGLLVFSIVIKVAVVFFSNFRK